MKKLIFSLALLAACSKKDGSDDNRTAPTPVTPVVQPTATPVPSVEPEKKSPYAVIEGEDGLKYHTGLIHGPKELRGLGVVHMVLADCENLPDEFDLRKLGTVPDIRNQGNCGSCWAFSKTASLESALLAGGNKGLDLSEQELVSCDTTQYGCSGGLLSDFKYQIEIGQSLESDLPYTSGKTGSDGNCKGGLKPAAKGVSFAYIGNPNKGPTEQELKCALYKTHTVPWITVSASNAWGNPPKSEKTVYTRCRNGQTNHAVGVVGWFKDQGGKTAFIMKNSWGEKWGDKGYMSLPLGCDAFGDEAAYIVTSATPCKPPMIKLPAEITAYPGVEVLLGVKESSEGWTYEWFDSADVKIGTGAQLYVTPAKDSVYKLVAGNKCGKAESSVLVKVLSSK